MWSPVAEIINSVDLVDYQRDYIDAWPQRNWQKGLTLCQLNYRIVITLRKAHYIILTFILFHHRLLMINDKSPWHGDIFRRGEG